MTYTSPIITEIDQRYIDVPFETEADICDRLCGMLPPEDYLMGYSPDYEASNMIYPEAEWPERIARIDETGGWLERCIRTILDQGREPSCFPAGTLIRMADGSVKPIERISLLDDVVTAEGRTGKVLAAGVKRANKLARLRLRGHGFLQATAEHPILTKRGYVPIGELVKGDLVALTRAKIADRQMWISTADHIDLRWHKEVATGSVTLAIPGKSVATITRTRIPDVIHFTPGFGRLIGLFLAEGNVHRNSIVWTFGIHELDTLAKETSNLLASELGVEGRISVRKAKNTVKVTVYGKQWARFFESMCGTGAFNKRVHPDMLRGPEEFLQAMLGGWLDGDGHNLKQCPPTRTGCTISKSLALSMFNIANDAGMRPAMRLDKAVKSRGIRHRHPRWTVRINAQEHDPKWRGYMAAQDDDAMWRPVDSIEQVDFDGWVYNFEVERDNSYVADGIGVHNCVYAATAQATQIVQAKQFGVHNVRLLSWISGYRHNGTRVSGSSVPGAAVWMEGTGLQPRSDDQRVKDDIAAGRYKHAHPATGYGTAQASGWKETARHFRTHEWFKVTTVGAFVSALINGWVILGGRDGHCVCHVRPMLDGGKIISMYANSWGTDFGATHEIAGGAKTRGFGYDTRAKIQTMVSRGAWAIRTVIRPSWMV